MVDVELKSRDRWRGKWAAAKFWQWQFCQLFVGWKV